LSQQKKYAPSLGLLFLAFFPIITVAGGGGGASETTQWNAGTDSCVITPPANSCSHAFTWPTPLSTAPCSGCFEASLGTVTGAVTDVTIDTFVHQSFLDLGNDFATAGKWTNMPAAQTEIFGDLAGQHWLVENWVHATTADFVLNCPTASNSATATLTVQYSPDTSTTWISIPNAVVNISNANCATGLPTDSGVQNFGVYGATFAIPTAAQIQGVFLRIIGQNGGGIGDVPDFVHAYVLVDYSFTVKFQATVQVTGLETASVISVTAKINNLESTTTTVNWKMSAWTCKTGGSGPC